MTTSDDKILGRVHELIAEEHALRQQVAGGTLSAEEEHARLRRVEEALDQCWDLLRQRRARREAGQDPEAAHERPTGEVEGYLQ